MLASSTPNLSQFKPLPKQLDVIKHIRGGDYESGTKEILLSGSVGSAKSLVLAHLAVTHCLLYSGANFGIGRLALPDLKQTLCRKIREHLFNTGVDYRYNETTGDFKFIHNRSTIQAISWADGNMEKLGSHEFSAFAIEELTETKISAPYEKILQRVNRLPHIKEPFLISGTNPDSPAHWAYEKLIQSQGKNVSVFYSNTFDNPFLPHSYIHNLIDRLDPKMARRMVWGEWVEVDRERLYYAYEGNRNFINSSYKIDDRYPIRICFDFNIGEGKPLSAVLAQHVYVPGDDMGAWHFFNEVIVDGQRTLDCMEEMASRGLLDLSKHYIVHGDASGRNKDTRQTRTDYDIITDFLGRYTRKDGSQLRYELKVPRANPGLRDRHNTMNAYMFSASEKSRLFVYKEAPTVDKGFRLTALKPGGQYIEDDKPRYQHCTTAAGYGIMYEFKEIESRRRGPGVVSHRG